VGSSAAQAEAVVCIVDDDDSLREGLSSLFRSVGLDVATFAAPAQFLSSDLPDAPSCLVLDIRMPGVSGLDFQDELLRAGARIPIIFVTGHGDIPMSVRAMKAGAVEFLTKPFREQELLDAVHLALERDRARREDDAANATLRAQYESLTPREREVIRGVTTGLMNKQIAGELGVSEITVKVHRGNVMRKMGAQTLAELINMINHLGLDRPWRRRH
jgi:FixJ family two-component response regulator